MTERKSRAGKIALWTIGGVVVLVGAVAVALPMIPLEARKDQIAALVRQQTGHDLTIAGPMRLSLLPSLGARLGDVTLSRGAGKPLVAVEAVEVDLKLLPLLAGSVQVNRFVLVKPEVNLAIAKDGQPNWSFAPGEVAGDQGIAVAEPTTTDPTAPGKPLDLRLGEVAVIDGTVSFVDHRSGQAWRADDLDLSLSLPSMADPAKVALQTQWNGQPVALTVSTGAPNSILAGQTVPVTLTVEGPVTAGFTGTVAGGTEPAVVGEFTVKTASVMAAAKWVGFALTPPAGKDLGKLDLGGKVAWPKGGLTAAGGVDFGGTPLRLDIAVAKLADIAEGKSSAATLALAGEPLAVTFDGTVSSAPDLAGAVNIKAPSLRRLAAWAGQPLDESMAPGKLGALDLAGMLNASATQAALTKMALTLDDLTAKGAVSAAWSGARPALKADLVTNALTLDAYMARQPATTAGGSAAPATGGGATAEGWSDAPIDASALKTADLNLKLASDSIALAPYVLGRTELALVVDNGKMTLKIGRMDAYDGRLSGSVVLDAGQPSLALATNLEASGVQLLPLLTAVAEMDRLEGTGVFSINVTANGRSQRDLVATLNGKGSAKATDGAIVGVNIGKMVRSVTSAFSADATSDDARTDFAELGGTFTIAKGVVSNDDLRLLAPLFRLSGKGTVDLPPRTLNYRLEPKLVASSKGQGGTYDKGGVMVPVVISGSWSNPSYTPDLSAVTVEDVQGTVDSVKDVVEEVKKDPGKALEGLLGGGTSGGSNPLGAFGIK